MGSASFLKSLSRFAQYVNAFRRRFSSSFASAFSLPLSYYRSRLVVAVHSRNNVVDGLENDNKRREPLR